MSERDRRDDDGAWSAPQGRRDGSFRPPAGVRARLGLARAALLWERLWPALWPAVAVAGAFLAVALLDLLPVLGPWPHAAALAGFAALFAGALWAGVRHVRMPDPEAARRRLERDSGLAHRPLAGLDDRLATGPGDADGAALWRAHHRWLLAHLGRMRLKPPRGSLAARDPFGLRAALALLLVIAAAAAGPEGPQRLLRALAPEVAAADAPPAQVDVWIDPPAYTGRPPRFLAPQDAAGALELPEGSQILAQVQGGRGRPVLTVGGEDVAFEPISDEAFKASTELEAGAGSRLAVRQGEATLAAWRIRVLADRPPAIEFTGPPGQGQRNALRLEYTAADDYGLERVAVRIARSDAPEAEPLVLELPLPGLGVKTAESHSYHDLTPHPWAGLPVTLTLVATDARGQTGKSDPLQTVLPERIFQHPVARTLVELRKQLTLEPDNRYPVVRELGRLGERPRHFFGDIVVSLAIRSAERRLIYDQSDAAVAQVQRLLWETALRIEEGELAVAERDLRRIQRELMEALARGASDEEIDRLMREMQGALDRFLQALAEQLAEQMARADGEQAEQAPDPSQMLRGQDLREMLEMARRMAESGARNEARDMLARLQEILENLRMSPMARGMSERAQKALDMMRGLESLTERQRELLDRSFRRSQRLQQGQGGNRSMPGQQGEGGMGSPRLDAERQEAVRRSLGRLLRELGNVLGSIPRPLGRAEQEMRGAVEALRRGEPGRAVGPQGRALDQLRQGMQAMSQAFMQQMGQPGEGGEGQGDLGWRPGLQRDPLGRRTGRGPGATGVEDVDIPDEMQLKRAHEILRELRRRSGQRTRPELELDYIERLLQRF